MKRVGNLYEKIYDMENIKLAHKNAMRGKRKYREVRKVESNPDKYLKQIQTMLIEKTYKNSEYTIFTRKFLKKTREIYKLPYFPDRIVHHCIMQILEPIWTKTFIRDTYSSIKGRGVHDGLARVKLAVKDPNEVMCLKMDVTKFYPSIDHGVLKNILIKKIKCINTLNLLFTIIDSAKGVPIGNYLSQYFGNIYLTEMDHWIKEILKCKYYFRYCDDLVILSDSSNHLHTVRKQIEKYLKEKLNLQLKSNWQIFPIQDRGIDFLGYKIFHSYTLIRKSIKDSFKKVLQNKSMKRSISSYWGWFKFADTYNFCNKYNFFVA